MMCEMGKTKCTKKERSKLIVVPKTHNDNPKQNKKRTSIGRKRGNGRHIGYRRMVGGFACYGGMVGRFAGHCGKVGRCGRDCGTMRRLRSDGRTRCRTRRTCRIRCRGRCERSRGGIGRITRYGRWMRVRWRPGRKRCRGRCGGGTVVVILFRTGFHLLFVPFLLLTTILVTTTIILVRLRLNHKTRPQRFEFFVTVRTLGRFSNRGAIGGSVIVTGLDILICFLFVRKLFYGGN